MTAAAFLEIVDGRRGHFRLESGHHSALWLDLDPLFSEPRKVDPFVSSMGEALKPYDVSELLAHGAVPVVVGAPLVLGSTGSDHFAGKGLPVEAVARDDYEIWFPGACPLCASGKPLEDVAGSSPPP